MNIEIFISVSFVAMWPLKALTSSSHWSKSFFMCQLEDYIKIIWEEMTVKVSLVKLFLFEFTILPYYIVVFFSPSLFFKTKLSYGYAHIERIYKDIQLQERIARSSKILPWFQNIFWCEFLDFYFQLSSPWIKNSFLLSLNDIFN